MHVVGHVRNYKGEVDSRIEIRKRLNIRALARVEPDAFETDRRIVFSDILPGKTRPIYTARACGNVRAASRKILRIDPP